MYFATRKIKPIKYTNQSTSLQPSIYKSLTTKIKVKSADMIEAIIKSSFLFKRKLITLPFIKVFIPMVAPTMKTIIIKSVNVVVKYSIVKKN